ncbi:hypothetical protein JRO89_XS13G0165700 [Xanthoceras sorbifolium]|uniref:F-box protein n=1 Tax=Xanthoceras sorbifolium TaxID=99658 RepID=A0ABQ8H8P8_9ROSI|nr:hypothetical protein JRO89_XS13G0165700 [Xanthoceras sorbifolium]
MNWSEFNLDLLEEIARRIKLYDDFVAFSLVCSLFRSAATKENFKFMSSHIPLLMLPSKGCSNSRGFFDLPEGTTRSILLPECDGKKCFSSKGWLITIDLDWNMSLLNPFSRVQVELPHMKTFENWEDLETRDMQVSFIGKCALSVNPSLEKIICQFYAIDHRGRIMVCDVEEDNSIVARQIANMPIELAICISISTISSAFVTMLKLLKDALHGADINAQVGAALCLAAALDAAPDPDAWRMMVRLEIVAL